MNVAPSTTQAFQGVAIDTRHPLEKLNFIKTIRDYLGLESYNVPEKPCDILGEVFPFIKNMRDKFRSFFGIGEKAK
ncbi:hypothetical protein KJ742_04230 [Patescibacteria group bacterium]|nr:hypothetical protein [Patescibacteria group bacterium]MBU1683126.1 hypothetical protein [Patescibacteria group bacterium]MBU1934651.1 hypothetical protein [Patescibacteria group bacterium]